MNTPNIEQLKSSIEKLINEDQLGQAYKICNEILLIDPNNVKILKLKTIIEKKVNAKNSIIIKQELNKIKPLLENGLYEEYLKAISPLHYYSNNFPEISEKIVFASKKLTEKTENQRNSFVDTKVKEINDLIKKNDLESATLNCESLLKLYPGNKIITKILDQVSKLNTEKEIIRNKNLLDGNKYEEIEIFLLKLKKKDKKNKKIDRLIENNKRNFHLNRLDDKRDFIYKTQEEVKTLKILKKYDSALELCEKVLEFDENNRTFKKYKKFFVKKIIQSINKKLIDEIFEISKKYSIDIKVTPQNYLKI